VILNKRRKASDTMGNPNKEISSRNKQNTDLIGNFIESKNYINKMNVYKGPINLDSIL